MADRPQIETCGHQNSVLAALAERMLSSRRELAARLHPPNPLRRDPTPEQEVSMAIGESMGISESARLNDVSLGRSQSSELRNEVSKISDAQVEAKARSLVGDVSSSRSLSGESAA